MTAFASRRALTTASLPGELDEKLSAISRAGFDAVILHERDLITFAANAADVGRLVAEHRLSVDLFQMSFPDGVAERGDDSMLARLGWTLAQMQALGARLLEIPMDSPLLADVEPGEQVRRLTLIAGAAADAGVSLGLRPLPGPDSPAQFAAARDAIAAVGGNNLGLVLDSLLMSGEGVLDEISKLPSANLFQVIVSDAAEGVHGATKVLRELPGEGDLALADFGVAIAKTGFDGPWGVEVSGRLAAERARRPLAMDAYRSLVHLLDAVAQRIGQALDLLEGVPARARVAGVEFIEFTADESEARALGAQLRSLGFSAIAQHRSKRVTLWRQGEINIVINTEQSGFAHSAYVMHGTSVCDIGLLVDDAAATMARARAFGASVFSQRRGEGELDIPAVRGLGGSVMHFLDRRSELAEVWDTEFRPVAGDQVGQDIGLTRIDHVAQTMTSEEMVHWTLFNLSVFDVVKSRTVDVADPGGPVPSRAIANTDGSFRLTMNAVDTHRTFAGRFVEGRHGSSFQHIAFASDDLVATAERLAQNGFESLQLPDDYYRDLSTRFDLDPAFVETLKSRSILYDEDGKGYYLQLYSTPYAEGFFFEIVERRGGYDGYGAWNAPYRTASLKSWAG